MGIDRRNVCRVRELSQVLLDRARYLPERDRHLLRQVLDRGSTAAELAAVMGRPARTVQRRVRLLINRLRDPDVVAVLRHHTRWPADLADFALALYLHREGLRRYAARTGLTLHHARQRAATVRALIDHQARSI